MVIEMPPHNKFVKNEWTPRKVATRFLKVVNKTCPTYAYCNASTIQSFYGSGIKKEYLLTFLRKYINRYGENGLYLAHNPRLRRKLIHNAQKGNI